MNDRDKVQHETVSRSGAGRYIFLAGALLLLSACNPVYDQAIARSTVERSQHSNSPVHNMITRDLEFGQEWLNQPDVETLQIKADDGTSLVGYFKPNGLAKKKIAILVHGHRVDARMMARYAALYQDLGFDVLLVDNRAHGRSGGEAIGMGWLDRLDLKRWTTTLLDRFGKNTEIVLHGVSMGGAAVMMLSGEDDLHPQVKAIVEDSGYSSVHEEVEFVLTKQAFSFLAPVWIWLADRKTQEVAGYGFHEASALAQVEKCNAPILFIHGSNDQVNPTEMVHRLHAAATCDKELLVVNGAQHAMSHEVSPMVYERTVSEFVTKHTVN